MQIEIVYYLYLHCSPAVKVSYPLCTVPPPLSTRVLPLPLHVLCSSVDSPSHSLYIGYHTAISHLPYFYLSD